MFHRILQCPIAGEEIRILEGRRLVGDVVGLKMRFRP
jgi:hypothetical protein